MDSLPTTFNPELEAALLKSRCTQSLYRFVQEFWHTIIPQKPVWNWHIEYLCNIVQGMFEDVEQGRQKKYNLLVTLPPSSSKCECGDNKIFTPKGDVKIKDLDLGDEVYSYHFITKRICRQKIISNGSHYADCFAVELEKGETQRYSWNHPFWTKRGWILTNQLKSDDFVAVLNEKHKNDQDILNSWSDVALEWVAVKGIKYLGEKRVYHIGVDNHEYDHQNYFSGNCLVHNSSVFSQLFPAWVWCRKPDCRFITGSFSMDLAEDFARNSKKVIQSDLYKRCFGEFIFSPERAGHYINQYQGDRVICTPGTAPTGRHAHFILVDDPVNPIETDSEIALQGVNMWMQRVLPSRTVDAKITPIILIMQRLSVNDPAGMWLEKDDGTGTGVFHICLPASIENGQQVKPPGLVKYYKNQLFDPVRLPFSVLADRKKWMTPADYSAQYDQNPLPKEGLMFKIQNIKIKTPGEIEPIIAKVRYWDKAVSTRDTACYTVGTLMGKTNNGKFVILDVRRGKWNAADREAMILNTAKSDGKGVLVGLEQEPGPIWEEELVLMGDGSQLPLKEVRVGDFVINQYGDKTRVTGVHIQGELDCLKITAGYGGTLYAAPNHPFITPNGTIELGNLKLGDPIYMMDNYFEKREDCVGSLGGNRLYKKPCRCLTVEEGESFVANDFVVHNSGGMESAMYTVTNLAGFMTHVDKVKASKDIRAEPLAIQVEYGNVSLLAGDWNNALLDELGSFPRGKYKDQVDATTGAFHLLAGAGVRVVGPIF